MTPSARPMERFFNIAGPCIPGEHYMLPALDRMPEIRRLVARDIPFACKTLPLVGL